MGEEERIKFIIETIAKEAKGVIDRIFLNTFISAVVLLTLHHIAWS